MCGRFALTATPDQTAAFLGLAELEDFPARYNIAPTQPVLMATAGAPRAPGSNLPDLLFPVIDRIELDPPPPYAIGIGSAAQIEITPTVWSSSGHRLPGTSLVDVMWRVADANVVALEATPTKLFLRGVAAGTSELQALRADNSIVRIPNTPVLGDVPAMISVG